MLEEEAVAREKALAEANSRITQLEKTIKDMQKLVELKSPGMAAASEAGGEAQRPSRNPPNRKDEAGSSGNCQARAGSQAGAREARGRTAADSETRGRAARTGEAGCSGRTEAEARPRAPEARAGA